MHWAALLASDATQRPPPLTVKLTVPVGDLPATVAVKVTGDPDMAGLTDVVSAVEVATRPAEDTCTVASVEETEGRTLIVIPYVLSV